MGGERQLGRDPAAGTAVLHASERTRVTRLFPPGGPVVRKQPLGPDAQQRVDREHAMLERLRGVAGVAQLADAPRYPDSIVLADFAGTSLRDVAKPLPVDDLLGLAVQLGRAVAEIHRRGLMHRDIAPANVLVSRNGDACLIDFALATSLAELRPDFTHHREIVGTLAYLAPEQTGRTGRSVDQRSDLYALGATLYELATGGPPFAAGDALQLTHDHLARVPVPAGEARPGLPAALSDVIMRLLEKEPDHRYQSAEGLLYDLEALKADPAGALRIGEHDVPLRLATPSRLAGRETEVAGLEEALSASRLAACRGVLIGGAAGVGKTALADALRPAVTRAGGWFLAGKFDQFRRDLEFDAMHQVLRAVGRLLLAEPEAELAVVRERILRGVGANAALLTATVPEFAALLDAPPETGDPLTAQARAQRATLGVLRAVASPERPLVVLADDLQWAGQTPLGTVDLLFGEAPVEGLLLVATYREGELDAAALSCWSDQAGVRHLQLGALPPGELVTMVAEILRTDRDAAAELVEMIEPHTRGNPYDTVELLDALRRDGSLAATAGGWRWDATAVRAFLGDIAGMPAARAGSLPAPARELLDAMACLGGRAELHLLQAATGEPGDVIERRLEPAVDAGVLVIETGARPAVRFRHDQMREPILRRLDLRRRHELQLAAARRLARVPELFAAAAEQYLPVSATITDADERRSVVALLRRAAEQAAMIGDHLRVDTLLAAALRLVDPADRAAAVEMRTGRQAALFSLGRLEEADAEYHCIEQLGPAPLDRVAATAVRVRSLTHQTRFAEALDLGFDSLRECGIAIPAERRFADDVDRGFDRLYAWLDGTDPADDLARPELDDPTLLAATRLIDAMLPVAYFVVDLALIAWLALEALRIWIEHGPGPTVVGPAGHAAYHAGPQRGENAAAYRGLQRIVAVGEARGYEPGTSQARHMLAAVTGWFEPIENGVRTAQRAREGLIAGADLAYAGYTYQLSVPYAVECVPSLSTFADEVEAGLSFLHRTGNEQTGHWLESYQWLTRVLRGEGGAAPGDAVPVDRYAESPLALLYAYLCHALASAVFGDPGGLARHSAAAMELLPAAAGFYSVAQIRLLRGLSLAEQARRADGDDRARAAAELGELTGWFAACSADAPDNFRHIVPLLEAERAWVLGDFHAAALGFDTARREVSELGRSWHRAVITERAAGFHLAQGLEHAGRDLMTEACRHYVAWGATAKVAQMDRAGLPPEAPPAGPAQRRSTVTSGTIDLLGVLSASQALSSETSIERLHDRVAEVLGAMTGATSVNVLVWSEVRHEWLRPAHDTAGGMLAIGERDAPQSVLRYVQRTAEPLLVSDATRDERFARDPYLTGVARCSLLAVPIPARGSRQALLLLENQLLGDAFTSERLDVVKLIAGQLAVSLDNAQLYADYRQIADEQAALRRVAVLVAQGTAPSVVFEAVATEMQQMLEADGVTLARYEPDEEVTVVAHHGFEGWDLPVGRRFSHRGDSVTARIHRTGLAARMDHFELANGAMAQVVRELGVRSSAGAPILLEGRLWGVAVVYWSHLDSAPAGSEERIAHFAQLLETAIANADSRDQLMASRARLLVAGDEARRRVVRDLHDGAQQRLVHAIVTLKLAQQALDDDDREALSSLVGEALNAAQRGNEELRELARGILPTTLTHGGLRGAVTAMVERLDLPVQVDVPDERFPAEIEASAYFIVAEALTNIVKHSRATRAEVKASAEDGRLRVEVRDDGVGAADPHGHGLIGISDRVAALEGRLELESPPGGGTRVAATLPIARG